MTASPDGLAPRIKGALLQESVDWLGQLIAEQCVSPSAVGVRLEAPDIALLTGKLRAEAWYAAESVARIDEALVRCHGGDMSDVMRDVGRRRAQRMIEAWPSPLAVLGSRPEVVDAADVLTIVAPMDFGRWRSDAPSLQGFTLRLFEVAPMPETTRRLLEGLLEALTEHLTDAPTHLASERKASDEVIYRVEVDAGPA